MSPSSSEVRPDAGEDTFATLVSDVERRCPVTQMVTRSGLAHDSTWTVVPLATVGA